MNLKYKIKKFRNLALATTLSIFSFAANAAPQQKSDNASKEKIENIQKAHKQTYEAKLKLSKKQLAKLTKGMDEEQLRSFLKSYTEKSNGNLEISFTDFGKVFQEQNISSEQALSMMCNLFPQKEDGSIFISAEQLAYILATSELNKDKIYALQENYMKNMNEDCSVSKENLMHVLKEINPQHPETALAKAFIDINEYNAFKKYEQDKQKLLKDNPYTTSNYTLSYGIGEYGDYSINTEGLVFNKKEMKDINKILSKNRNMDENRLGWEADISKLLMGYSVLQSIAEREQQGKLIPNADKFIKQFYYELNVYGLEIGKDGKLCDKDDVQQQKTQTNIAAMKNLKFNVR